MKAVICANLASNVASRRSLISAIRGAGYDVIALSCPDSGVDTLEKDIGIPFYPIFMSNKGTNFIDDIRTFFSFLRFYREQKPDVVLHFNSKPDIYGSMAATMLRIPVIANITGLGAVYAGNGGLVRGFVDALYRMAFSGPRTRVLFQNADDRSLFLSLRIVKEGKTGLLPGSGVDVSRFLPFDRSDRPCRTERGTERFLFIGRLLFAKGVTDFIAAAEIVKRTYPKATFCILGEANTAKGFVPFEAIEFAVKKGLVEYPGNVYDVLKFLRESDCVVLPSYYREGVPRSLLEAAAMATPLIAADSIGTREPVRDGVNGFLCKPDNPADLADRMMAFMRLSSAEKDAMGKASRDLAVSTFSDAIVSRKYLELIPRGKTE
jgi:glycosyltransferase involved in cell wall biosynthesis